LPRRPVAGMPAKRRKRSNARISGVLCPNGHARRQKRRKSRHRRFVLAAHALRATRGARRVRECMAGMHACRRVARPHIVHVHHVRVKCVYAMRAGDARSRPCAGCVRTQPAMCYAYAHPLETASNRNKPPRNPSHTVCETVTVRRVEPSARARVCMRVAVHISTALSACV